MRILTGGVSHIARAIETDLKMRESGLRKPNIEGLSDLVACALACRNVNTAEWMSALPRETGKPKSKERYISRLLSNSLIKPDLIVKSYVVEILQKLSSSGETLIFMLDQSKIADRFECLMVSVRFGNRALPIGWKVIETKGEIGFETQKILLDTVKKMVSPDANVVLAGDRFYGTSALINWCQLAGWDYRLRLKSNLYLEHEGGEITTGEAAKMKIESLINAQFKNTDVKTNIGIIHEKGHPEPWIIAMNCKPSFYKVLDYGLRWGIESMFSDFKTRGFSITKTHLRHTDRIERLILIVTIALYWAVSTGMEDEISHDSKKNNNDHLFLGSKKVLEKL